jgi:hypothetical protein
LGTDGAHGESDDSQERSLEGKAGGEDSPLRMRRRVVHPPSKDGIVPSRRKTISGEITISETKEKVMHLNGNRRDTPRKTDKKEVERGSEKKPLKVYKKEISTNGKAGNGHSSQKIVKREEKVYIESSSDGDSDVSLEKQVTRGRRPKESKQWRATEKEENRNGRSRMCHQCQRNDKERVIFCTNCDSKRYCAPCIKAWYAVTKTCFPRCRVHLFFLSSW